jgi:hypothetical protein
MIREVYVEGLGEMKQARVMEQEIGLRGQVEIYFQSKYLTSVLDNVFIVCQNKRNCLHQSKSAKQTYFHEKLRLNL